MNSKTTESLKFKKRLGFNLHDVVNAKEQTVLGAIKKAIERQKKCKLNTVFWATELIFFL